ncbi:50S ribosomal protein L6 [Candidatus Woesearchaeota archaeon CG10_big_fil_rev_8_21_14_0_10_47_5]|nr:MAG: 50S ribosomal protein L6 [Candidatus Woesearchaeota archaeon CG10_big_fil_rev_8_21_14_0_10_47_5]
MSASNQNEKREKGLRLEVALPAGAEAGFSEGVLSVRGAKGEVKKRLLSKQVLVSVENGVVVIQAKRSTKRERKVAGTFCAHIKNMISGVSRGHEYSMKICAGHFPMNVSVSEGRLIIKNFLGEKKDRTVKIPKGVSVRIEKEVVRITSPDKELAGATASSIELGCVVKNRDRRVFQDGIYIIEKARKG